jgi:hypothetical protein
MGTEKKQRETNNKASIEINKSLSTSNLLPTTTVNSSEYFLVGLTDF